MKQSPGFFNVLARIMAVLASVLVVLLFPITLSTAGVGDVISNYDLVSDVAEKNFIQSDLIYSWMVQALVTADAAGSESIAPGELQGAMANLDFQQQLFVSKLLLPKEWAAAQLSTMLKEIYVWMDGEIEYPVLILDTRSLSEGMTSTRAERIARIMLDSWPACSPEMISERSSNEIPPDEYVEHTCLPEDERVQTALRRHTSEAVLALYADMPDELILAEGYSEEAVQAAAESREAVLRIVQLMKSAWLLPAVLLGVVMVLRIRSRQSMGRWWGIPLLAAGMSSFLAAILLPLGGRLLVRIAAQRVPDPAARISFLQPFLQDLFAQARGLVLAGGLLLLAAGIVLFIFFSYLPERRLRTGRTSQDLKNPIIDHKDKGAAGVEQDEENTFTGMFG